VDTILCKIDSQYIISCKIKYIAPLVRNERSHCRSKQLRARLATRSGRILPSACICRWASRTCLFSAIFKN